MGSTHLILLCEREIIVKTLKIMLRSLRYENEAFIYIYIILYSSIHFTNDPFSAIDGAHGGTC